MKTKKPRRILSRIIVIVAAVAAGIGLYFWNAGAIVNNPLPMPFGVGLASVMSGSMSPTLNVGDLVVVRQKDAYKPGDIVVYRSDGALVIHRLIEADDKTAGYVTKGDANSVPDVPIRPERILGAMTAVLPGMGRLLSVFKQPAVILVVLVLAVAVTELSLRRERRSKQNDLDAIREEIRKLKEEAGQGGSDGDEERRGQQ